MAISAAQLKPTPQQTGSAPRSLAARKSVFAQNRIPGMNRESNVNQIMQTGSSQTPNKPMSSLLQRQASLRANQLQSPMNPLGQLSQQQPMEDEEQDEQQESFQSMIQKTRIKGLLAEAAGINAENNDGAAQKASANAAQDAAKQAVKKLIPKTANVVVNFLSTALDLGTGSIALLVTIFIHLLSLGWLNVEMIYGTWIMKGKHPMIGKLSWDPIPMPVDKNGILLQGLVIMADLVVMILVVILFAIQALVLLVMLSPTLLLGFGLSKLF